MPYADPEKYRQYQAEYRRKHFAELNAAKAAWHIKTYWRDIEAGRKKARESARRDYWRNPKKFRARRKAWRAANPHKDAATSAMWSALHPEKVRASAKRNYDKKKDHPEFKKQERIRGKKKYRKRREAHLETGRLWRTKNLDHVLAWKRNYYATHKEVYAVYNHQRRARKRGACEGDPKAVSRLIRLILSTPRVSCHWCGKPLRKGERTIDHLIPLARGGKHSVTNVVPACRFCNTAKGAKLPHEFTGQH